jgi:hypothetical protein
MAVLKHSRSRLCSFAISMPCSGQSSGSSLLLIGVNSPSNFLGGLNAIAPYVEVLVLGTPVLLFKADINQI